MTILYASWYDIIYYILVSIWLINNVSAKLGSQFITAVFEQLLTYYGT